MHKYGFSIRTRNGHKVDNILIMAKDGEEAERRLRQMYNQCEIFKRTEPHVDTRRNAVGVDTMIGHVPRHASFLKSWTQ